MERNWEKQLASTPYLRWKQRARLEACAEVFVANRLSPVTWILFAAQQWDDMAEKRGTADAKGLAKKPPPLHFVFDPKRIAEQVGWCGSTVQASGITTAAPFARELMFLQHRMLETLDAGRVAVDGLDAYLDTLLPPDGSGQSFLSRWNEAVERAKNEARFEQDRLRRRALEGEWLW